MPGGDPRGPWCPKCGQPIREGEPSTLMHFRNTPHGHAAEGERWHAERARPFWDTLTPVLNVLRRSPGGA